MLVLDKWEGLHKEGHWHKIFVKSNSKNVIFVLNCWSGLQCANRVPVETILLLAKDKRRGEVEGMLGEREISRDRTQEIICGFSYLSQKQFYIYYFTCEC